jgi:hypothetical protein
LTKPFPCFYIEFPVKNFIKKHKQKAPPEKQKVCLLHTNQGVPVMHYTQDVAEFYRHNHTELKGLVYKICSDFGLSSQAEDVVSKVYEKFLIRKTLQRFNPNRDNAPKISTYIYRVVVNMVKALLDDDDFCIQRNRCNLDFFDWNNNPSYGNPYPDEVETAVNVYGMDPNYKARLYSNYVTQTPDDIEFDLNMFEEYLKKTNHVYTLERRKYEKKDNTSLSLLQVFSYMRKGYNSKYIAYKYGVSVTFITTLKTEIKLLMIKFGFVWGEIPDFEN